MSQTVASSGRRVEHVAGGGGAKLAVDRFGAPDAPPVILLHGGGQTRHAWGATGRMLGQRGRHALALDLRGHGDSDWPADGDYSLDAFKADLLAVMGQLALPPILVGASLGGLVALLAAGESDAPLAALVLVDITPAPSRADSAPIRAFMAANPEGFASLEDAAEAVARYLPHRTRPARPDGLMKNLRERDGRLHWHWDPRFIERTSRDMDIEGDRLTRAATAVRAPIVLIRGEHSELVGEAQTEAFVRLLPRADVITVPAARHMVAGDQNSEFGRALLGCLDRLGPTARTAGAET
jgi:non-heme chloroperoxidase